MDAFSRIPLGLHGHMSERRAAKQLKQRVGRVERDGALTRPVPAFDAARRLRQQTRDQFNGILNNVAA